MPTLRFASRRRVRVAALVGSLEATAALALAHLVAGGGTPDVGGLVAFGVLVYAASGLVLRDRARIRVMLPALLATQVLGHGWLMALGGEAAHVEHTAAQFTGHLTAHPFGLSPSMLAAHLVAAGVTGLMWALRRRVVDVLLGWAERGVLPAPTLEDAGAWRRALPSRSRGLVDVAPTRGPPVRQLATA